MRDPATIDFDPTFYPEEDDQPLGESELHVLALFDLLNQLRGHFRDRPDVHVGGNQFVYWVKGDARRSVCPDLYVKFDSSREPPRRVWKTWEEGGIPEVVIEITSSSTRDMDQGSKRGLYELLGVQEYYLFDATSEYLQPQAAGFRLVPPHRARRTRRPVEPAPARLAGPRRPSPGRGSPRRFRTASLGRRPPRGHRRPARDDRRRAPRPRRTRPRDRRTPRPPGEARRRVGTGPRHCTRHWRKYTVCIPTHRRGRCAPAARPRRRCRRRRSAPGRPCRPPAP